MKKVFIKNNSLLFEFDTRNLFLLGMLTSKAYPVAFFILGFGLYIKRRMKK